MKLWMGGVNPAAIKAVKQGTVFTIIGARGSSSGRVTLKSRDSLNGLIGIGTLDGGVQQGTLLKAEGLSTGT